MAIWSNQCFPRYFTTYKWKPKFIQRFYTKVYINFTLQQKLEMTLMLIIQFGQTVIYSHDEILLSNKKGWTIDTFNKWISKYLSWVKEPYSYTKCKEPHSQNSVIVTGSRSVVTWRTRRGGGGTGRAHWPQRAAPLPGVTGMLVIVVATVCICQSSVVQFNYVQFINHQFHLSKIIFKVKKTQQFLQSELIYFWENRKEKIHNNVLPNVNGNSL